MAPPKVDHSKLACTGCGGPRDRNCARCLKCLAATKRALRARDPERHRRNLRSWCARNPDKVRRYSRDTYLKNAESVKAQARKWAKLNPKRRSEIMCFQNAKRRSRIKSNGGRGFSKQHWNLLLERSGGLCAYCRAITANSIDHFVPLSKGGLHDFANIVPACAHCNSLKRENDPESWVITKFGIDRLAYVQSIRITPEYIVKGDALQWVEQAVAQTSQH